MLKYWINAEIGRMLLIIQKTFIIPYLQNYKFLFQLKVLVKTSGQFLIAFDHFHLHNLQTCADLHKQQKLLSNYSEKLIILQQLFKSYIFF